MVICSVRIFDEISLQTVEKIKKKHMERTHSSANNRLECITQKEERERETNILLLSIAQVTYKKSFNIYGGFFVGVAKNWGHTMF